METDSKKLRSSLWQAANILRGSAVDRTDWKGYILPLIFFKRICDVWDEEKARMINEYGEDFNDEHHFQIPLDSHWNEIRATSKNVGSALKKALQEIERANPDTLWRVFGSSDWGDKEKFSDELVKDLLEEFSTINLGNNSISTDILGDAYEYLIGKFADVTRRNKAGEFYTPRNIVKMMINIINPKEGESIYDPACGTGGMLLGAVEHIKNKGGDIRNFYGKIFGQEKNLATASVARMNLFLNGIEDFKIAREDTLRKPIFLNSSGGLEKFDCVIANPPFALKKWGRDIWESDTLGRTKFGLPPDNYGEYAFVEHMIASMSDSKDSRMAVVLPQGTLFREADEGKIRRKILQEDLIEAVIGLASNLFYGTSLAGCIVIFRKNKKEDRKNKILFIDAQNFYEDNLADRFLTSKNSEEITSLYRNFKDVEDLSRVVSLQEINEEDFTLNISRYVIPTSDNKISPLKEVKDEFEKNIKEVRHAESELQKFLLEDKWI